MPGRACLNVLARSALALMTVARRSASSGAGLAAARAVTPTLSVLGAHKFSGAEPGQGLASAATLYCSAPASSSASASRAIRSAAAAFNGIG